jgi:hypothetical protein
MTPYELRALGELRRRGQAPQLAVFIVDDWQWGDVLTEQIGVLAIKVRNARDFEHNWGPLAGLWAYLVLRNPQPGELADFATAILQANPVKLTVWDRRRDHHAVVWEAA